MVDLKPGISADQQQLFSVGDRVARAVDISGVFFKQGTVHEVYRGVPGHMVTPPFFYSILWDGDAKPVRNYLGTGLKKLYTVASCGLPPPRI